MCLPCPRVLAGGFELHVQSWLLQISQCQCSSGWLGMPPLPCRLVLLRGGYHGLWNWNLLQCSWGNSRGHVPGLFAWILYVGDRSIRVHTLSDFKHHTHHGFCCIQSVSVQSRLLWRLLCSIFLQLPELPQRLLLCRRGSQFDGPVSKQHVQSCWLSHC